MSSTDAKLHRIFLVAGERTYSSRSDLAREIAKRCFDEFSYEEEGEIKYLSWGQVADYVAFSSMIGLLNGEYEPYIKVDQVSRKGFDQTLGEKVENFADAYGFSASRIKSAIRTLVGKIPAELPTPRAVFRLIAPKLNYHFFYKAVTVLVFQERTGLLVRSRQTFLSPDTLKE